jgi:hypothetical protein
MKDACSDVMLFRRARGIDASFLRVWLILVSHYLNQSCVSLVMRHVGRVGSIRMPQKFTISILPPTLMSPTPRFLVHFEPVYHGTYRGPITAFICRNDFNSYCFSNCLRMVSPDRPALHYHVVLTCPSTTYNEVRLTTMLQYTILACEYV